MVIAALKLTLSNGDSAPTMLEFLSIQPNKSLYINFFSKRFAIPRGLVVKLFIWRYTNQGTLAEILTSVPKEQGAAFTAGGHRVSKPLPWHNFYTIRVPRLFKLQKQQHFIHLLLRHPIDNTMVLRVAAQKP